MPLSGDARFGAFVPPAELDEYARLDAELVAEGSLVSWARLEPMPLTTGAVDVGLAAPVADPLWLLCRQRQFGELDAEDGGSPIEARASIEHHRLDRFRRGAPEDVAPPQVLGDDQLLEAEIEAETVGELPERVRAEAGRQLLRLLAGDEPELASLRAAIVDRWAFAAPSDELRAADPDGARRRLLLAGRVPDGAAIAAELRPEGTVRGRDMVTLGGITVRASIRTRVRNVVTSWATWLDDYVLEPEGPSAWRTARLGYDFSVSSVLADGEVTLRAADHHAGSIDWYSFDHDRDAVLDDATDRSAPVEVESVGIPQAATYPGMPADRFWELEDTTVLVGDVEAGPGDLATLALVDFAIVGSTDWFLVPIELPVGAVARVTAAEVITTFGERVPIPSAVHESSSDWTAFELSTLDPDALASDLIVHVQSGRHVLVGPPLEQVEMVRDEMSNIVWGIEVITQGPTGEPVAHDTRPASPDPSPSPADLGDAELVYRLMTDVPDRWHPLVPIATDPGGGTRRPVLALELRSVPAADGTTRPGPTGRLLRLDQDGDGPLRVDETAVPREGITLTRHFEHARTSGGDSVLWIGRRRTVVLQPRSADLRFDRAVSPTR